MPSIILSRRILAACGLVFTGAISASAQTTIGPVSWQLQPYCNVVTLTLRSGPAGFSLEGTDDLCGGADKGSAVGVASPNNSGNYTLNFTIVTAPSGKPVHVSAVVSPANGSGTWSDSLGNSGTFAFFGNTPGLPARPQPASGLAPAVITSTEIATGAVGASDIDPSQVQARVSGTCPAGQSIAAVNSNGTVTCVATASAGPLKRATFNFVGLPLSATSFGTAVTLSTLTFTPSVSGTAIAVGRGYCNLTASTTGEVGAAIGTGVAGDTTFTFSEAVAVRLPRASVNELGQIPFFAERAIPVTAGVSVTINLLAFRLSGTQSLNCLGSYRVEVHDSTLP